jgi:tetratricopeptide (TPR) repeat protein
MIFSACARTVSSGGCRRVYIVPRKAVDFLLGSGGANMPAQNRAGRMLVYLYAVVVIASLSWLAINFVESKVAQKREKDLNDCKNSDASADLRIRACTVVIKSGQQSAQQLAPIFYNRGKAFYAQRDYDHAAQDYSEVIRLSPNDQNAIFSRALAYENERDYDHALQDYTEAIRLNPNYAGTFNNRGNVYASKHDYDRAIQDYDEAIRLDPRHVTAFIGRANAYSEKGDYDRAFLDYDAAVRVNPRNAWPLAVRASAYSARGDYDRAIGDYSEIIRLDKNDSMTFNNRCWARAIKGDVQPALSDCNESLRLKNGRYALDSRGFVYLKMKNPDAAIADYNAALAIDPKAPTSLYGRGMTELMKGDKPASDADIAAAIKIQPDIAEQFAKWGVPLLANH